MGQPVILLSIIVACALPHSILPGPVIPMNIDIDRESEQNNQNGDWPGTINNSSYPYQSPIDIITSKVVTKKLPILDIVLPKKPGVMAKILNSGHTVYVYIEDYPLMRPFLKGGPLKEKFIFQQMHFHWGSEDFWGSEHFIDGESFAAEIHLVYYNSKYGTFEDAAAEPDGLAVLTIFAKCSDTDNPLLNPLYELLPNITEANSFVMLESDKVMQWSTSALILNNEYFTYRGSLTTPSYSENVVFIILLKPITMSKKQLAAFRETKDDQQQKINQNHRRIQPIHNRSIVISTYRLEIVY